MKDKETLECEALAAEYAGLLHAVQSGVAACIGAGIADDVSPKHLRVGVNSALIDVAAMAELLTEKNVITRLDYFRALVRVAKREREAYEAKLSARLGKSVRLG